jgi:hypothetical protein
MELWWSSDSRGKPKKFREKPVPVPFVHHEFDLTPSERCDHLIT